MQRVSCESSMYKACASLGQMQTGSCATSAPMPAVAANSWLDCSHVHICKLSCQLLGMQVAFTGSTAVGKQILVAAAATMKDVTLECGGKSPLIVFADANIDEASPFLLPVCLVYVHLFLYLSVYVSLSL